MSLGDRQRPVLGILMLDNAFERYVGDLGNPATFDIPVLFEKTAGASTAAITTLADDTFLDPFARSAERLVARGANGIVTSCGFLALYQEALAARVSVPVATSALLQVAIVNRILPKGRRVGVLTFNGDSLGPSHLAAVGAPLDTPIVGLAAHGRFRRALLGEASVDGYQYREAEAVEAAQRLLASHANIGALVLECTNLVPHGRAIQAATGLPVYDVMTLVRWFYAGLEQAAWQRA
jgi:Asp/Glu/hydantoin racemase